MQLSKLQKYILLQGFWAKNKLDRQVLLNFYVGYNKKPSREIMVNTITASLERLIKKSLIVGFGEITKQKIYLDKIRLTALGRKLVKKGLGEQRKLPLKIKE
jgi:hypothetical protein